MYYKLKINGCTIATKDKSTINFVSRKLKTDFEKVK